MTTQTSRMAKRWIVQLRGGQRRYKGNTPRWSCLLTSSAPLSVVRMNSFPSWLQANSLTWFELLSVRTILCERGSMKLSSSQVDPTQSTLPVGCHATHRLLPGVCTVPVALHCVAKIAFDNITENCQLVLGNTSLQGAPSSLLPATTAWNHTSPRLAASPHLSCVPKPNRAVCCCTRKHLV